MRTSDERIKSIKDKVRKKRDRRIVIWTAGSVACVFIVLAVVCSLPILGEGAPNVNAYKGDEYYPLIEKINSGYSDNRYSIFSQIGDAINKGYGAMDPVGPMEPSIEDNNGSSGNKYEETTNNQVDGVTEGDLLKRSSTHAFYLKNGYSKNEEPCLLLQVYSLAGSSTELVTEHYIRANDETSFTRYESYIEAEMFLNDDATRLTVIATSLSSQNVVYTTVVSLDVSNVANVTELNRVYVSGKYLSSRKVDGKLLVITNFNIGRYGGYGYDYVDYDKKETYVPQCGSELGNGFIPVDDIYIPNGCPRLEYTVLALLDEATLDVYDSYALFSYTYDVYVSQDYVVVARNNTYYYYGNEIAKPSTVNDSFARVCEMVVLSYKNGFDKKGEIWLDGFIKDRYSMDEKDGVLRVFTTVDHTGIYKSGDDRIYGPSARQINVSLYCVDLNAMQIVASKESFAPSGDEVKSARFDGDKAYVCTARLNTDPVFYFDLSDLNNITYVDTGEIEGFSVNLIKFNDLLLGIGQGDDKPLKVELYRESSSSEAVNGVESVVKYERLCDFSHEYKAHFIDSEHNLIGLHVYDWINSNPNTNHNKYLLLRYDEESETLQELYLEVFDGHGDYTRALYADNGVYVFGTNAFTFVDLQSVNR